MASGMTQGNIFDGRRFGWGLGLGRGLGEIRAGPGRAPARLGPSKPELAKHITMTVRAVLSRRFVGTVLCDGIEAVALMPR